jgi:hypothetical protein
MARMGLCFVLVLAGCLAVTDTAAAVEAVAVKETAGVPGSAAPACPLAANLNGTCGNLRYYNICSGYIWIFSGIRVGDAYGTRFDGACATSPGKRVRRAITYYRATVPAYNQGADIYLDRDTNNDGCPDGVIASDIGLDPGERWNCSNFNVCVPVSPGQSLIVRSVKRGSNAPNWSTEGPYTSVCDPVGVARSFYYPREGGCFPWIINSPTGRNDNFLTYLVISNDANCNFDANESVTWGQVKGLFR